MFCTLLENIKGRLYSFHMKVDVYKIVITERENVPDCARLCKTLTGIRVNSLLLT